MYFIGRVMLRMKVMKNLQNTYPRERWFETRALVFTRYIHGFVAYPYADEYHMLLAQSFDRIRATLQK